MQIELRTQSHAGALWESTAAAKLISLVRALAAVISVYVGPRSRWRQADMSYDLPGSFEPVRSVPGFGLGSGNPVTGSCASPKVSGIHVSASVGSSECLAGVEQNWLLCRVGTDAVGTGRLSRVSGSVSVSVIDDENDTTALA